MILLRIYKPLILFSFLFAAFPGHAQERVSVHMSADRQKILIGEPIQLSLQVSIPSGQPIRFFSIDSIDHFEILERLKIDTTDDRSFIRLSEQLRITSFDSGHWVIPPFYLGGDTSLATDSLPVDVVFSEPFNPDQDYHDIKDILEAAPEEEKSTSYLLYWIIGGAVLLISAVLFFLLRKKKKPVVVVAVEKDPYDEALEQLDALRSGKPESRIFHSRLVDIFRQYIFRRAGIQSMQKTTDDLVKQLREVRLDKELYKQLTQALRVSDYVKFAKYETTAEDDEAVYRTIRSVIDRIEAGHVKQTAGQNQAGT